MAIRRERYERLRGNGRVLERSIGNHFRKALEDIKKLANCGFRISECGLNKEDHFVKSPGTPFAVIPAKAGIQSFRRLMNTLDSGFHRSDDFFRSSFFIA